MKTAILFIVAIAALSVTCLGCPITNEVMDPGAQTSNAAMIYPENFDPPAAAPSKDNWEFYLPNNIRIPAGLFDKLTPKNK